MGLLMAMLPLYLVGNLHCLGMCGPLVMMIGHHRFRFFYFLGRFISYAFAGALAGAIGGVVNVYFQYYHLPETASFVFGGVLIGLGVATMTGCSMPGKYWLARTLAPLNNSLSILMLRDKPFSTFLFGFFTLFLPCGQTLIVFSACALSGSAFEGFINGCAFAILTSPSLFLAMKAHAFLRAARKYYQLVMGISALVVGAIALLRGMAEMGWVEHLVLSEQYHLVLF